MRSAGAAVPAREAFGPQIVAMARAGCGYAEIAEKFELSVRSVQLIALGGGIRLRRLPAGRERPRYLAAVEAVRAGAETSREVAADLRISVRLAAAHLAEAHRRGLLRKAGVFQHHDCTSAAVRWRAP